MTSSPIASSPITSSPTTSRGYIIEESGSLNNFAIEPEVYVDDIQQFGFNHYAELINGRLAMMGFISAIAFELITGQGIVTWLVNL
ncbi:MAG: Chlorophyll A-B binding protein [Phormidesmis priestleyi Ana]|uniref:Chlorophyll A-B binding protein n=1 Tax=Phormidesmis priestleyi Ana TaxID=1666911 RepID=A0A0P7Z4D6_9CYAN|nr:MAG: Chlorophyll A-B binding protein [Phormidesmis priestleyi Ana]